MSDPPFAPPTADPGDGRGAPSRDRDPDSDKVSPPPPVARVLGGILLLAVGVLWLLDATGAIDLRWRIVLPAALIGVGVACTVLSVRQRTTGLVAVGAVLAVAVVVTALLPDQLSFRVGDQATRPIAAGDIADEYSHGIGQLTIDLSAVTLDDDTTVRAGLGMGELEVRVPDGVTVRVVGSAGIGEVSAFGRTSSGFGVRLEETFRDERAGEDRPDDAPVLRLELSVGIGKVEVRR